MVVYNNNDIDAIVFELKNNKALIAPTDTVPGILAINKNLIYKIKSRSKAKKIILFVSSWKHIDNLNQTFIKLAQKFWPGNLTLIKDNISYRAPNYKVILEILSRTGPLYCSSANISGEQVIKDYNEAVAKFDDYSPNIIFLEGDYIVNNPSTIYDIDKDKILREGDITYEQIRDAIKN